MLLLQWLATLFGILQGLLILLKRKENWIFLLAQSIVYLVWAGYSKLYADVLEQSVYVILSLLGFSIWYQKFKGKFLNSKIHRISFVGGVSSLGVVGFLTIVFYFWLLKTEDPFPVLDSITTAIGFVATFLMARKVVECWILWLVSDVIGCIIYFKTGAPGLLILNFVWTFMAIGSFVTWYKEVK